MASGLFLKEKKHEAHGETFLHVGCNNFNKVIISLFHELNYYFLAHQPCSLLDIFKTMLELLLYFHFCNFCQFLFQLLYTMKYIIAASLDVGISEHFLHVTCTS